VRVLKEASLSPAGRNSNGRDWRNMSLERVPGWGLQSAGWTSTAWWQDQLRSRLV